MFDSRRLSGAALLLLPAGLIAYAAFSSGGFFPAAPAYIAIVLVVVLAARTVGAARPFEGVGRATALALVLMSAYAVLTLISEKWSHAPGTALIEFDRALAYLLALLLFGSVARTRGRAALVLAVIGATGVGICTCGLITRLLPHVWPLATQYVASRLSFPLGYWNGLGLLAAVSIVIAVYFASALREPLVARVLAAGAVPILATTLYFTFSRGSIGVCIIALIVFAVVGRPRGFVSALVAIVPATTVALLVAYHADALSSTHPTTVRAVGQGHHVAFVLFLCTLAAVAIRAALGCRLDARLLRFSLPERRRRRLLITAWAALAVAGIVAVVASSGAIARQWNRFLQPPHTQRSSDLRARLTDPSNNGRIELWRVAWRDFGRAPVLGQGAGTFREAWARQRPNTDFVLDAHSLYLQTLDELGIVGAVLLGGLLVLILIRTATRIRGPDRVLFAAIFSVILAWAIEAGIDWDWELPAVTLVVFVLGGIALARPALHPNDAAAPAREPTRAPMTTPLRTAATILCILAGVAPAYLWWSQRKLDRAASAFAHRDCATATSAALGAVTTLGTQAQGYEILAYCDIRGSAPALATTAIRRALELDPNNWHYARDLAVVEAAGGLSPIDAARRALTLNPHDPFVLAMWRTFADDTPSQWEADGARFADQTMALG